MRVTSSDVPLEELCRRPHFQGVSDAWNRWRNDRFAPPWRPLALAELPPRTLPFATVVELQARGDDDIYRFWGSGLVDVTAVDMTGRGVAEHKPTALARAFLREYQRMAVARDPLGFRHMFTLPDRDMPVTLETIRLPLSQDGARVTHVLSYSDWHSRFREWQRIFELSA